jgi:type IV pilus biogenesis protein CpaD/CtpE
MLAMEGCTADRLDATHGYDIGTAVRTNIAAQAVDPSPHYDPREDVLPADRTVLAEERYRKDRVKPPIPATGGGAGGANGGGQGAGQGGGGQGGGGTPQ